MGQPMSVERKMEYESWKNMLTEACDSIGIKYTEDSIHTGVCRLMADPFRNGKEYWYNLLPIADQSNADEIRRKILMDQ